VKVLAAVLLSLGLGRGLSAYAQSADTVGSAVTAAQVAARSWLSLLDRVQYGESWDSAATFFRTAVSKPDWEAAVHKARGPFHPFGARKLLSASFQAKPPNAPPGEYVVLQYQTQAAGEKAVVETVTPMKDKDGSWRVSGYYIRPE
jgi:hypothetical protein